MSSYFYVRLDAGGRPPVVYEFPDDNLRTLMDDANVSNPLALSDYDMRVFKTEDEADAWLERYTAAARRLRSACKSRDLPAMLLKRRYLVQLLMGEKMQTYRTYRRAWPPGQLFNFHDQIHFVTVRLKRIVEDDGLWRYDYDMP